MDYILFYSQFSPSSMKLINQFPNIKEKAVSVDSIEMRKLVKSLNIVCVPTLIVHLGRKIIDRIIGATEINNWLLVSIYRANQLSSSKFEPEHEPEYVIQELPPQHQPQPQNTQSISTAPQLVSVTSQQVSTNVQENIGEETSYGYTNLEDLVLEDVQEPSRDNMNRSPPERTEPHVQMIGGSGVNTLQLAETMKKERESFSNRKL